MMIRMRSRGAGYEAHKAPLDWFIGAIGPNTKRQDSSPLGFPSGWFLHRPCKEQEVGTEPSVLVVANLTSAGDDFPCLNCRGLLASIRKVH